MVKKWKANKVGRQSAAPPIYGLGFIGAAVYYLHTANAFNQDLVGILKAFVWPAYLVYHLLGLH